MASNKVKFGLKNVHYALLTDDDGTITYETPVPIPGAVSMSLAPQGETNTFYADNIAYYVSTANNGYQGDLEIAVIPDSFRKDVLGETEDETSKVLIENASAEAKPLLCSISLKETRKPACGSCTTALPPAPMRTGLRSARQRPPARKRCPSPLPRWRMEKSRQRPQTPRLKL